MFSKIRKFMIARAVRKWGLLFVKEVASDGSENVFYCVDIKTELYSFWRYNGFGNVEHLCGGLSRSDAQFMLTYYGG